MTRIELSVLIMLMLLLATLSLQAEDYRQDDTLRWISINAGGIIDAPHPSGITIGQSVVGVSVSENHQAHFGFWPGRYVCDCMPGDCDGNGIVEITDVVCIISWVFVPGSTPPTPYEICSGDADCNCIVEITDAVYIISYVFVPGSPAPCSCEDWVAACGWPLRK